LKQLSDITVDLGMPYPLCEAPRRLQNIQFVENSTGFDNDSFAMMAQLGEVHGVWAISHPSGDEVEFALNMKIPLQGLSAGKDICRTDMYIAP